MFGKVTFEKMIGSLQGSLGEDDYSEPLNILIDSEIILRELYPSLVARCSMNLFSSNES